MTLLKSLLSIRSHQPRTLSEADQTEAIKIFDQGGLTVYAPKNLSDFEALGISNVSKKSAKHFGENGGLVAKINERIFIFSPPGFVSSDYKVWGWSSAHPFSPLTDYELFGLANRHPIIRKSPISDFARDASSFLFIPFISEHDLSDDVVAELLKKLKSFYGNEIALDIVQWYVVERDGKINKNLQNAILSLDLDNSVSSIFNQFRNGLIGKLIDWDDDVLLDHIARVKTTFKFETRLSAPSLSFLTHDGRKLAQLAEKIEALNNITSFDQVNYSDSALDFCLKNKGKISSVSTAINAFAKIILKNSLSITNDVKRILSRPENEIIEIVKSLDQEGIDLLIRVGWKFILENPHLFSNKMVERARWQKKHELYDIDYSNV